MKRILIPIDFSEHSLNAISYGQMLLKNSETTFYLFAAFQSYTPSTIADDWGNEWLNEWESEDLDLHTYIPVDDLEKVLQKVKQKNTNAKHHFKIESTVASLEQGLEECVSRLGVDSAVEMPY